MREAHTQERTSAAERGKVGATKPSSKGDLNASQIFAGIRMPNFAPGFSAAADSWGTLVRAAQSINREQAAVLNEEAAAVSAEMETLRRSETLPDLTNSLLKCALLQVDLAVHGNRIVSDIMRQTWFDILSRWSQDIKSPLSDIPGRGSAESASSNRSR